MEDQKEKKGVLHERGNLIFVIFLIVAVAGLASALAIILKVLSEAEKELAELKNPPIDDGSDDVVKSAEGAYRYGAVAADNEICSKIGIEIMARNGGSAVDAAIASLLCLGVVHPHSVGIGGGFLMTIYDKAIGAEALIAREMAPLMATRDMYINTTMSSTLGGSAVAVPGEIRGYHAAWTRFGRVNWTDLFEPSIQLCNEGYEIGEALAIAIAASKDRLKENTVLSDVFLNADGSARVEGDLVRMTLLGATLRRIADDPDSFYTGTLAEDILQDIEEEDGVMQRADLVNYKPLWKAPVSIHLENGDYTLYGPPPPSSAVVVEFALNVLDGYKLVKDNFKDMDSKTLTYHRFVEAMKFAFGKRSALGDEDFTNVTELLELMQSNSYADTIRHKINDTTTQDTDHYEPEFEIPDEAGTSHLSVLSPDGIAVSVTSTVNLYFGSKVAGSRTGIIFNNEMDDFSTPGTSNSFGIPASPSNYIEPGKRPMSSMSPMVAVDRDGNARLIVGASGGTRIISGILQVSMQGLWLERGIGDAIDEPRLHNQLLPAQTLYEEEVEESLKTALRKKGHTFKLRAVMSVVQGILNQCPACSGSSCDPYCITAACDRRKHGAPDGF